MLRSNASGKQTYYLLSENAGEWLRFGPVICNLGFSCDLEYIRRGPLLTDQPGVSVLAAMDLRPVPGVASGGSTSNLRLR